MRTVDNYSEYKITCLIEAERQLRFTLVGMVNEFRRNQLSNRLADIRDEIKFRRTNVRQIAT